MKYTGPDCRQCRREGCKLYLKGARCNSENCSFDRKKSAPGQHGKGRKKQSGYSLQLREKQKAKRIYGLTEKQFLLYYRKATEMKGVTGELMLELLERRLDNVVYRLGLGASRAMSRQIVTHGHITVNGKLVNIPSYLVKKGDVIAVKEAHKESKMFEAAKKDKQLSLKSWLSFDNTTLTGTVVELPTRADIEDIEIKEHLIVELYSK